MTVEFCKQGHLLPIQVDVAAIVSQILLVIGREILKPERNRKLSYRLQRKQVRYTIELVRLSYLTQSWENGGNDIRMVSLLNKQEEHLTSPCERG